MTSTTNSTTEAHAGENALERYLQRQQDIATLMEGLLQALAHARGSDGPPNGQDALIFTIASMAAELSSNLDVVNLPSTATEQAQ